MGERACVDLTRRLEIGQGMAIGSVSSSLCLIHGETIESVFVPTRPFRVNAGAIHSYVLMADGKTKYLSELVSGDEVAILSKNGIEDSSTVGRVKIENRPLLMVRFSTSESEGQIILQQAETVRLVSSETDLISVTEIEIGDRILIISDNRFRHTGIAIDGDVVER
jgi:3-dehydroquinate synthase II